MSYIFISHSSKDKDAAKQLHGWLKENGFDQVFLDFDKDDGIPPGSEWEQFLYDRLNQSHAVILIFTKHWQDSKWCFAEFVAARSQGKAVFPIVEAPGGEKFVGFNLQSIDFISDRKDGLDRLAASLVKIAQQSPGSFPFPEGESPFPGFNAFEEKHAAVFHGRDDVLSQLRDQLRKRDAGAGKSLVLLLGGSGTGKSSLLRAGVIPRLKLDKDNWIVLPVFRPGYNPLASLIDAVLQPLKNDDRKQQWEEALATDDPDHALREIERALRQTADALDARIAIVIDQGEEAFIRPDQISRSRYFALLSKMLARHLPFTAIMALRSEYLDNLQREKTCTAGFDTFPVEPLPLDRLGAAIRGPAHLAGITVEDDFVTAIAKDAERPDAMPLVAFALKVLYERTGENKLFSLETYKSLAPKDDGDTPLDNVVRLAIEKVLPSEKRSDEDDRMLRELFVSFLVRVDKDEKFASQPAVYEELPPEMQPLVDQLIDARLLSRRERGDATTQSMIEVSHESIFKVWPDLARWLENARDFLIGRERLTDAAALWEERGRDNSELLRGVMLERAQEWIVENPLRFTKLEREFSEISIETARVEKERQRKRQRMVLVTAVTVALVFAILSAITTYSYQRATEAELQTKSQLRQTLINQSLHLASKSLQITAQGDAVSGILIAYAGLPGDVESESRPYVPEAENALFAAVQQRRELRTLRQHSKRVTTAVFSADGKFLATGSSDKNALLWNAQTGDIIHRFEGHSAPVQSAHFSTDGRFLFTGSADGTVRVWSTKTGAVVQTLEGDREHPCKVLAIDLTQDDAWLAVGCEDKSLRIWDSGTGNQKVSLDQHRDKVWAVAFSPDGKWLVSSSRGGAPLLWNMVSNIPTPLDTGNGSFVSAIAFSGDGKRFATGALNGTTAVWDLESRTVVKSLKAHVNPVSALSLDWRGDRLATASADKTVKIWDLTYSETSDLTLLEPIVLNAHEGEVWTVDFSPDGRRLVSGSSDATARVWDARAHRQKGVRFAGHDDAVNSISISDDGTRLLSASLDGTVRLWDTVTGVQSAEFPHGDHDVKVVQFGRDASTFTSGSSDGKLRLWSVEENAPGLEFNARVGEIFSLARHPVEDLLLVGGSNKTARLWDPGAQQMKLLLPEHAGIVAAVAFHPNGRQMVTGSLDGWLRLWDVKTGKLIHNMDIAGADIRAVAFSANGDRLIVGLSDGTARVLEVKSAKELAKLSGHGSDVTAVRFAPAGDRIITGSADKTVRVWSAKFHEILIVPHEYGSVHALTLHAGPQWFVAVASGASVVSWRLFKARTELMNHVRNIVPRCLSQNQLNAFSVPRSRLLWCYK